MNLSIYPITLDLQHPWGAQRVQVKQNDTARQISVNLTDGGKPYPLTADCEAVFTAKKPDGTVVYNLCQVEGNAINYRLTAQTVSAVGEVSCEIRIYNTNGAIRVPESALPALPADFQLITTASFILEVAPSVCQDGDVVSTSETTALTEILKMAKEGALGSVSRVVSYPITRTGWKRILLTSHTQGGMVHFSVERPFSDKQVSSHALGVVFGGIADTDGDAKPTLYQLYSKESGFNRKEDQQENYARIVQVRLCYPEPGRCFDHLLGSGYAIYKAPVYLDIYVDFTPAFEGETAELTVSYLGTNDVLLNTSEKFGPMVSEFGIVLQEMRLVTNQDWDVSIPNGARLGQGVFTALEGTEQSPVMLNRLESGIYFIEGVGKDNETATQRDLPAGLYIVKYGQKSHIRCIPAEDLPITTL